jgi:TPR repeat protein
MTRKTGGRGVRHTLFLAALLLLIAGAVHADFKGAVGDYNNGNYAKALAEFEKLAADGDPLAMNNAGLMYNHGQGTAVDNAKAKVWYEKAAKLGNPAAMNNLGVMYEKGEGVSKDDKEAAKWYQKASVWGLRDALYNLGELYREGRGVARDPVEAYYFYTLAAVRGDQDANQLRQAIAKSMSADQMALAKNKLAKVGVR